MKKILGVIVLSIIACAIFVGCSGGSTVSPAWADREVLTYTVVNNVSEETVGQMTVTNIRRPEDKTLGGKSYDADGKTLIELTVNDTSVKIVFLTKQYTVLAEEKTVEGPEENYVLNSYHSGKYAYYSYNGEKEKKINVGNVGYTEGEYLYNYIRSYAVPSALPSSVKIADYKAGTAKTVTTSAYRTGPMSVPFPSGEKVVACSEIAIALSDTPQGEPIYVWFTDDTEESKVVSGLSISPSKKFPVKIIENELTYTVTSITVG